MFSARFRAAAAAAIGLASVLHTPASSAYLFWVPPNFTGPAVRGDEPGIGLPMPGATPAELQAHMLWNLRAGLNVAALQCQFSPALMTVKNYNTILNQHAAEFNDAYKSLSAYFKKQGKTWQTDLDSYTTKTYNGFSTLHAQLGFCETAALIGREALQTPRGKLGDVAMRRMREFRNSLVPTGDALFSQRYVSFQAEPVSPYGEDCFDKKGRLKKSCLKQS